ncbi:hypothetical protein, partial [Flammeovirga sp. OC4]|uniref:hypothetical protein n=1 Tax=Flammeovirga sp. OC4 TaxID=1382345 RepID=UPI001C105980
FVSYRSSEIFRFLKTTKAENLFCSMAVHCKLNYRQLSINLSASIYRIYFQTSFFFIFPLMKNEAKNLGLEVKS